MQGNIITIDYAETNNLSQKKTFYGYVDNNCYKIGPTQMPKDVVAVNAQYMLKLEAYSKVAGMGGGGSGGSRYTDTWTSLEGLKHHFDKHGKQFRSPNPQDYARQAQTLYRNRMQYQRKTDEHGVTRVYDPKTNSFGSYNPKGKTITFFKPSQKQRYFDRQKGE